MPKSGFSFIPQKDDYDCGIACAAMIAGVKYNSAMKYAPDNIKKSGLYFNRLQSIIKKIGDGTRVLNTGKFVIPNHFDSEKQLRIFLKKTFEKLDMSLLICLEFEDEQGEIIQHWLLYDIADKRIKDPNEYGPATIRNLTQKYFNVLIRVDLRFIK